MTSGRQDAQTGGDDRRLPTMLGPGVALALGAAACLALNLPGQLSYDSVLQLAQGRSGVYNAWHPPVMAWMLGLGDAAIRGTGLFVVFDVVLIFGALAAFALPASRSPRLTTALAVIAAATPQLTLYPGIVWKDVLYAGGVLAGFACLVWVARTWRRTSRRWALILLALALLGLAALTRQNGALAAAFGAAALGWIAAKRGGGARRGWAYGIGFLACAAAVVAAASMALAARGDKEPSRAYQWEDLQTYDIVSALNLEPSLALPELARGDPALEQLLRTQGLAAYSPARIDPLQLMPALLDHRAEHRAVIGAQWRDLVLHRPLLYLRVRLKAFEWVMLTPRIEDCLPIYVAVDGPQPEFAELGLKHRSDGRERALETYTQAFVATPVLRHLPYALLGLALLVKLVLRRRSDDVAVAAMLAGAFAYCLSFLLISIACDYRYLYALDLAAMAAALYAAATSPLRLNGRR